MIDFATCAELLQLSGQACAGRSDSDPGGAARFPKVSADGKTQIDPAEAHATASIPASPSRRRTSSQRSTAMRTPSWSHTPRRTCARSSESMPSSSGKAQTVSGVTTRGPYTLRIRTTRPLPDMVSRLTMPYFCPSESSTPPEEIDDPLGSGPVLRRLPSPQPPGGAREEPLLPRSPSRECRPGRLDGRARPGGLPAGDRAGRRSIGASSSREPAYREHRLDLRDQRPNGRFISIRHSRPGISPSTTIGRRSRGQARSRSQGHQLGDRPPRARSRLGLPRRQAHRPDPAAGHRAAGEHLPARGCRPSRVCPRRAALLAKAKFEPDKLVIYTATSPRSSRSGRRSSSST